MRYFVRLSRFAALAGVAAALLVGGGSVESGQQPQLVANPPICC